MKSVTLLPALFISIACIANGQIPSSSIERIKTSVVPVVCLGQRADKSPYLLSIEGTGFFAADDGTVVTAGHVAKGLYGSPRVPVCEVKAIYLPVIAWNSSNYNIELRVITIKQCWWNDDVDVGVCVLEANPFTMPEVKIKPGIVEFSTTIQKDGTALAFTAFPLNFLQPITSQGTVGTYRAILGETLAPRDLVIDKNAWPGASGSPVYTADSKVIGILIQRGYSDASGLAFARTTAFVQKFLADNKADREKAQNKH